MMTEQPTTLCIESLLDTYLPHNPESAWYCTPDIPEKKLRNAIAKYASDLPSQTVLALADGTVFDSAKEGILITADTLYSCTTSETFSVPVQEIASAEKIGGWPEYAIKLHCYDGTTHIIQTTCFDKHQDRLVEFFNQLAQEMVQELSSHDILPLTPATQQETSIKQQEPTLQHEPAIHPTTYVSGTSLHDINTELNRIEICQQDNADDVGTLFETALHSDTEIPLLKGYCQYVGFNARQVDAVTLLTNKRLLLFSMENGAKITFVELTKRLLGKLPVPFLDSIVGFFLFTIPGSIFTALRGGKNSLINRALEHDDAQLISQSPPLRKVQDFDFEDLAESVSQLKISNDVCTSFLNRKFGITFAPLKATKSFSIPKDLILPKHENAAPFQQLLTAIRPTLDRLGLSFSHETESQSLTLAPTKTHQQKAAA